MTVEILSQAGAAKPLYYDDSEGYIGIGIAAPSWSIHIVSGAAEVKTGTVIQNQSADSGAYVNYAALNDAGAQVVFGVTGSHYSQSLFPALKPNTMYMLGYLASGAVVYVPGSGPIDMVINNARVGGWRNNGIFNFAPMNNASPQDNDMWVGTDGHLYFRSGGATHTLV